MNTRSTADVVNDHLALAQEGAVEADIARNFAPDCALITTYGVFRGHDGGPRRWPAGGSRTGRIRTGSTKG